MIIIIIIIIKFATEGLTIVVVVTITNCFIIVTAELMQTRIKDLMLKVRFVEEQYLDATNSVINLKIVPLVVFGKITATASTAKVESHSDFNSFRVIGQAYLDSIKE